jgi:putative hydrolase of the HAD superfamily
MLSLNVAKSLNIKNEALKDIKNIIFDLGGVIINIHYDETIKAFQKLGFNFDGIYTQFKQTSLFDELETGKTKPETFRDKLRNYYPSLNDSQIDFAWNAMMGSMPEENIRLLKKIRLKYRTFLLSNTNAIHIDYFKEYLNKTFGHNPLPDMFEQTWFSHEIGERKPNVSAYQKVLKLGKLDASETLFIDDLYANIEGARKAGLHAYHLQNESISQLFEV